MHNTIGTPPYTLRQPWVSVHNSQKVDTLQVDHRLGGSIRSGSQPMWIHCSELQGQYEPQLGVSCSSGGWVFPVHVMAAHVVQEVLEVQEVQELPC